MRQIKRHNLRSAICALIVAALLAGMWPQASGSPCVCGCGAGAGKSGISRYQADKPIKWPVLPACCKGGHMCNCPMARAYLRKLALAEEETAKRGGPVCRCGECPCGQSAMQTSPDQETRILPRTIPVPRPRYASLRRAVALAETPTLRSLSPESPPPELFS